MATAESQPSRTTGRTGRSRQSRRALLRRAHAMGMAALEDDELAEVIDHRCAKYIRRTARLPGLRDAGTEDYADPGRVRLAAAIELGRRSLADPEKLAPMRGPRPTGQYLIRRYGTLPVEHTGVLLFDRRYRLLEGGDIVLARGQLDECPAPPREVLACVLRSPAASFVLWHNHPSGDTSPSMEDMALTRRVDEGSKIVGVQLIDHLVVSEACYYSFKENGQI